MTTLASRLLTRYPGIACSRRTSNHADGKIQNWTGRSTPDLSLQGVIFDVDPTFSNTEEWWNAIPEDVRPQRDQPFYHLLAENEETEYVAYVSEQNLEPDMTGEPVRHPQVEEIFEEQTDGSYLPRSVEIH